MNLFHFCFLSILIFSLQIYIAECKNILAVFPHMGKSHFIMYEPYVYKLAERGHKVTVLTWLNATIDHENVKTISFGDENYKMKLTLPEYESFSKFLFSVNELAILNEYGQKACAMGLSNPEVKELIKSKEHFDLVVVEFFNTDCFAVFAHIFNAPLLGIFSSALAPWHSDRMGNPDNPSYIVSHFSGFKSEMSFFERIKNTISLLFSKAYYRMYYSNPTDRIIKARLGKGIPRVNDIVFNTSIFLVNSHFTLLQPRPLVPGVVEVGGLHVQEPKKLPNDLEKFLDSSKNGVVYFSLGSVTQGSTLTTKKKNAISRALGNLTQNVIWKWEEDEMPEKPKNVFLKKWVPQNDLLAHPKIKVFVTHGGLMSVLEAVTYGVPMVLIPLFGDQFLNAAAVEQKGCGIVLDYFSLNEKQFLRALNTVIEDKRYHDNAKLLSARFKERPLSPMNSAIYWTEYVLKFKGALHLRPANTKLYWFSECLLDVSLFIAGSLSLLVYLAIKSISHYKEMKKQQELQKKKK